MTTSKTYHVGSIIATLEDLDEILMGGPWVGSLSLNGIPLEGEYLNASPFLIPPANSKLLLVKYYRKDMNGKRWQFHLQIIDLLKKETLESVRGFQAFTLISANEERIEFYEAMGLLEESKTTLTIDSINFKDAPFDYSFIK